MSFRPILAASLALTLSACAAPEPRPVQGFVLDKIVEIAKVEAPIPLFREVERQFAITLQPELNPTSRMYTHDPKSGPIERITVGLPERGYVWTRVEFNSAELCIERAVLVDRYGPPANILQGYTTHPLAGQSMFYESGYSYKTDIRGRAIDYFFERGNCLKSVQISTNR